MKRRSLTPLWMVVPEALILLKTFTSELQRVYISSRSTMVTLLKTLSLVNIKIIGMFDSSTYRFYHNGHWYILCFLLFIELFHHSNKCLTMQKDTLVQFRSSNKFAILDPSTFDNVEFQIVALVIATLVTLTVIPRGWKTWIGHTTNSVMKYNKRKSWSDSQTHKSEWRERMKEKTRKRNELLPKALRRRLKFCS